MSKKIIGIFVCILFVGASVLPSMSGDIEIERSNVLNQTNEAASVSADEWSMFRHDLSHSGYSTSTAPSTNDILWTYTTGNIIYSSPSVVNGKIFVGSDDLKLYCLNADTGAWIWDYTIAAWASTDSSPAIANGKVYIGVQSNKLYCLNADNGSWIWEYDFSGFGVASSPAVANGKVYVGNENRRIYCLNADNGAKIWEYTTGYLVISSPAVANEKVYIGSSNDYKVYCLNADTGSKIWDYTTGGPIDSSPAIANGKVYIGSSDYKVYCFGTSEGNHPPDPPSITGETNGDIVTYYDYTIQTTDPDQNNVQYFIDWRDYTTTSTGFNESGKQVVVRHLWNTKGTYDIKVKAIDIYGAESDWVNLTVTMPYSYNKLIAQLLELLIQRFPHAFPLLRHLLEY